MPAEEVLNPLYGFRNDFLSGMQGIDLLILVNAGITGSTSRFVDQFTDSESGIGIRMGLPEMFLPEMPMVEDQNING